MRDISLNRDVNRKIIKPDLLSAFASKLRQQNRTIATLNGSFDLLHAGHLYILYEAAKCADVLIVLLNSDISIQGYKGPNRPLIPLKERMKLMAAIEYVDYVSYFDALDPREILELVRPDVHVNGKEYGENCIEAETVRQNGGRLHLVDRIPGLATSEIIKKIKSL